MNRSCRKNHWRRILAALIACILLVGTGSALAIGLVEMDSELYYDVFEKAYAGFVPTEDGNFGSGPRDGETWSIGTLLGSRGGASYYVVNCNEWVSLREEASTESTRIRKVYYGEEVSVLGTWYDWALVYDFTYGHYGWILRDYLSVYDPDDLYVDDGFDYDLEPDGEYWYTSTELFDYVGNPISPAAAYLGLSYEGRVPIGGDDAVCDCYTNGSLKMVGDDQYGILDIELTGSLNGYTLGGAYVGMEARQAFDTVCDYCADCYENAILRDFEGEGNEDYFYISFEMYDRSIGSISAYIENNRVTEISLFLY